MPPPNPKRPQNAGQDSDLFRYGMEAQEASRWAEAIEFYTKDAKQNGESVQTLYHLAFCLQEISPSAQDDDARILYLRKALEFYQRVLEKDPNHHEASYNSGYVQEELGECEAAIKSFEHTLLIKPDDKDALINLGNCFMTLGDFDKSASSYEKAIKLDPNCVMSHYNLGQSKVAAS